MITVGPPISSATLRASSAVVQKPYLVTGIPASSTILRLVLVEAHQRPRTLSDGLGDRCAEPGPAQFGGELLGHRPSAGQRVAVERVGWLDAADRAGEEDLLGGEEVVVAKHAFMRCDPGADGDLEHPPARDAGQDATV